MLKTKTREAADRRLLRNDDAQRRETASRARTERAQTDWVLPGMTRAQLRDHVIEQIG